MKVFDWSHSFQRLELHDESAGVDHFQGRFEQWLCRCNKPWTESPLPNVLFYPAVILGLIWTFAPPGITLVGMRYVSRRLGYTGPGFVFWLAGANLALFVLAASQFRRFIAGPTVLLAMFGAVGLTKWLEHSPLLMPTATVPAPAAPGHLEAPGLG
jgi:hypothetical protein